MLKNINSARFYEPFFHTPSGCPPLEQLDAYVHFSQFENKKVIQHLERCKRCAYVVALIENYSFKLNPEKSRFDEFWEKRGNHRKSSKQTFQI